METVGLGTVRLPMPTRPTRTPLALIHNGANVPSYVQLDDNICQAPIRQLPALLAAEDAVEARQKFVALAQPAAAGAVTATAFVDAENDGLYVAVAGDCRAVAGWQAPDGSWRCDVLTEDQMGENPKEVAR